MCSKTKPRPSRHINLSKPEYRPGSIPLSLEEGWYEPEALNAFQQLFDTLWLLLRKQVFPWDVEASREQLAIQLFKSIPGAQGDAEQLKQAVLSLWQIQQLDSKRSGGTRHKAIRSNPRLVTPTYDPQHLPAP
jgi:hypothetical protein